MAASKSDVEDNIAQDAVFSVLPDYLSGGPHGLGDPNDTTLRHVEREIVIPQRMRDKAKERCAAEVAALTKCGKEMGLLLPFKCRKENTAMKNCMVSWYENPEFKEECTKEFLADRAYFRATGIPRTRHRDKRAAAAAAVAEASS